MILAAAGPNSVNFIPKSGILDTIFHQSWLSINVLGHPGGNGYKLTLIGLIIVLVIAVAANAITERLTAKKVGGLLAATIVTIFGALLFQAYVSLPFDVLIEGVPIVAALLGSIVIAVFYNLIRAQFKGGK
jgi:uncharacterized protein YqgC (DUF456 family)